MKPNSRYAGKIFPTNNYGDILVLEHNSCKDVKIKFLNTDNTYTTTTSNILKGEIRDRMSPSVYGVGVHGDEKVTVNGKLIKEYVLWCNMLQRCYNKNCHKLQPTYKDCSASDNFKYFPYFKEWCSKQVGFGHDGWHLDKDILVKGNKFYGEDTCVFVPKEINMVFTTCSARRGKYHIGVSKKGEKFQTSVLINGKYKYLGAHDTELEAFCIYKQAKEQYIRELASKWNGQIDHRVYDALMNYQVEITD